MQYPIFVAIVLLLSLGKVWAENNDDKFHDLALGFQIKGNALEISPYWQQRIWLNGVPQSTESENQDPRSFLIRPGDILYSEGPGVFYRYKLGNLDNGSITFTRWTFAQKIDQLSPHSRRFSVGRMLSVESFTGVPLGMLIEYDQYLEAGGRPIGRLK